MIKTIFVNESIININFIWTYPISINDIMEFLITTWFGCFIVDSNKVLVKKELFCDSLEKITQNLIKISNQEVLDEEMNFKNHQHLFVNQKRLRKIGSYHLNHKFFNKIPDQISSFTPSKETLRGAAIFQAEKSINDKLNVPDFQIIQKIHAIDDLYHAINVFDERLESWNIFTIQEEHQLRFNELKKLMNQEIVRLQEEIKEQITDLAPNTCHLIGPMLTARLLVHAGSLKKMAMLPASSIQLLGAEKALFRFKKEGGKPPKHGVLFQHESLLKASKKQKGRIARILALKIILAIRADVYTKRDIGEMLKSDFQQKIRQISKFT